jgi:hypothetical protein
MRTPRRLVERSLALHRLIADKIRREPELFAHALENIRRWKPVTDPRTLPYFDEWEQILSQGIEFALAKATEDSEHAADLRQCTPFAGILSQEERDEFFRNWRW